MWLLVVAYCLAVMSFVAQCPRLKQMELVNMNIATIQSVYDELAKDGEWAVCACEHGLMIAM